MILRRYTVIGNILLLALLQCIHLSNVQSVDSDKISKPVTQAFQTENNGDETTQDVATKAQSSIDPRALKKSNGLKRIFGINAKPFSVISSEQNKKKQAAKTKKSRGRKHKSKEKASAHKAATVRTQKKAHLKHVAKKTNSLKKKNKRQKIKILAALVGITTTNAATQSYATEKTIPPVIIRTEEAGDAKSILLYDQGALVTGRTSPAFIPTTSVLSKTKSSTSTSTTLKSTTLNSITSKPTTSKSITLKPTTSKSIISKPTTPRLNIAIPLNSSVADLFEKETDSTDISDYLKNFPLDEEDYFQKLLRSNGAIGAIFGRSAVARASIQELNPQLKLVEEAEFQLLFLNFVLTESLRSAARGEISQTLVEALINEAISLFVGKLVFFYSIIGEFKKSGLKCFLQVSALNNDRIEILPIICELYQIYEYNRHDDNGNGGLYGTSKNKGNDASDDIKYKKKIGSRNLYENSKSFGYAHDWEKYDNIKSKSAIEARTATGNFKNYNNGDILYDDDMNHSDFADANNKYDGYDNSYNELDNGGKNSGFENEIKFGLIYDVEGQTGYDTGKDKIGVRVKRGTERYFESKSLSVANVLSKDHDIGRGDRVSINNAKSLGEKKNAKDIKLKKVVNNKLDSVNGVSKSENISINKDIDNDINNEQHRKNANRYGYGNVIGNRNIVLYGDFNSNTDRYSLGNGNALRNENIKNLNKNVLNDDFDNKLKSNQAHKNGKLNGYFNVIGDGNIVAYGAGVVRKNSSTNEKVNVDGNIIGDGQIIFNGINVGNVSDYAKRKDVNNVKNVDHNTGHAFANFKNLLSLISPGTTRTNGIKSSGSFKNASHTPKFNTLNGKNGTASAKAVDNKNGSGKSNVHGNITGSHGAIANDTKLHKLNSVTKKTLGQGKDFFIVQTGIKTNNVKKKGIEKQTNLNSSQKTVLSESKTKTSANATNDKLDHKKNFTDSKSKSYSNLSQVGIGFNNKKLQYNGNDIKNNAFTAKNKIDDAQAPNDEHTENIDNAKNKKKAVGLNGNGNIIGNDNSRYRDYNNDFGKSISNDLLNIICIRNHAVDRIPICSHKGFGFGNILNNETRYENGNNNSHSTDQQFGNGIDNGIDNGIGNKTGNGIGNNFSNGNITNGSGIDNGSCKDRIPSNGNKNVNGTDKGLDSDTNRDISNGNVNVTTNTTDNSHSTGNSSSNNGVSNGTNTGNANDCGKDKSGSDGIGTGIEKDVGNAALNSSRSENGNLNSNGKNKTNTNDSCNGNGHSNVNVIVNSTETSSDKSNGNIDSNIKRNVTDNGKDSGSINGNTNDKGNNKVEGNGNAGENRNASVNSSGNGNSNVNGEDNRSGNGNSCNNNKNKENLFADKSSHGSYTPNKYAYFPYYPSYGYIYPLVHGYYPSAVDYNSENNEEIDSVQYLEHSDEQELNSQ